MPRKAIAALPHSDKKWRSAIGAPDLSGEKGWSTLERLWLRPSLDVNGIWGGFQGEGAKTVIPAEAHAKISMRLVPGQTPKEIYRKVTAHLKKITPKSVKLSVRALHGGEAWVTPTDHPALQAGGRALKRAFGKSSVFIREGGSIPVVAQFQDILGMETVMMGFGLPDDHIHSPNERFYLPNYYNGILTGINFLAEYAELYAAD